MAKLSKAQARRDIFLARYRADLKVRRLHSQLADRMSGIIAKHVVDGPNGTKVLDEMGAAAAMRDIDTH